MNLEDSEKESDKRPEQEGQSESRSCVGLAFNEALHWCAAEVFEGIINTFWLLWSSCHRKYNLHQDYKIRGSFLSRLHMLLLLSLPTGPLIALGLTDPKQSTNYSLRHLEQKSFTLLIWKRKGSSTHILIDTHIAVSPSLTFVYCVTVLQGLLSLPNYPCWSGKTKGGHKLLLNYIVK